MRQSPQIILRWNRNLFRQSGESGARNVPRYTSARLENRKPPGISGGGTMLEDYKCKMQAWCRRALCAPPPPVTSATIVR